MNSNKASTSNISKYTKPKIPSRISARSVAGRRAVFFVLLAVLVLGFSVKSSLAVTNLPAPGAPIPPNLQQKIDTTTGIFNTISMKKYVSNGFMPTSPSEYGGVLKYYGGYSQGDINAAGIQYANQFSSNGSSTGISGALVNYIWPGTVDSDDTMLQKWKSGQNIEAKSTGQKALATAFLPNAAAEQAIKTAVSDYALDTILAPVIALLFGITYFLKIFVGWSAEVLDFALNPALYNGFTNSPMVIQGWTVVRDVCNLFFLLVLLFIAICTILKIEKYHAKKTLLMLIIMALLINFSKPIAIFVFDGSQLLMNFFLSQLSNSPGGSGSAMVTKATEISNMIYNSIPTYFSNSTSSGSTSVEILVSYLFAVVFLFIFMVALLVTAIFLLIRIVVIMLLIIVSPFAFFAAIVPDFSKMSSQWWSSLFEYSYYGPAAAFFLLLATQLSGSLPTITQATNGNHAINFTALSNNIIHYATTIIFLYASIFMAKKFGGGAGAAVVGNANKVMKWGARMGGTGLLAAGTLGQYWRAKDAAKGTLQGISQRSGMSWLTKESREKKSKERQEKWEGKVAPFSMATARKKAKEEEFKDQAKVDAGIARGSAHDLLIGSKRGTLTPEQLKNSKVQQLIASSPELRKEILGNLRDKGQSHTAAYLRSLTPEKDDIEKKKTLEAFGKEEIYNNKKLGDMDWEKVITFKHEGKTPFEQILVDRLGNIAQTNAQGFLNIASNLDGTKQDILRDNPKFQAVLASAQENARGNRGGGQNNQQNQNPAQPPPNVPWN